MNRFANKIWSLVPAKRVKNLLAGSVTADQGKPENTDTTVTPPAESGLNVSRNGPVVVVDDRIEGPTEEEDDTRLDELLTLIEKDQTSLEEMVRVDWKDKSTITRCRRLVEEAMTIRLRQVLRTTTRDQDLATFVALVKPKPGFYNKAGQNTWLNIVCVQDPELVPNHRKAHLIGNTFANIGFEKTTYKDIVANHLAKSAKELNNSLNSHIRDTELFNSMTEEDGVGLLTECATQAASVKALLYDFLVEWIGEAGWEISPFHPVMSDDSVLRKVISTPMTSDLWIECYDARLNPVRD